MFILKKTIKRLQRIQGEIHKLYQPWSHPEFIAKWFDRKDWEHIKNIVKSIKAIQTKDYLYIKIVVRGNSINGSKKHNSEEPETNGWVQVPLSTPVPFINNEDEDFEPCIFGDGVSTIYLVGCDYRFQTWFHTSKQISYTQFISDIIYEENKKLYKNLMLENCATEEDRWKKVCECRDGEWNLQIVAESLLPVMWLTTNGSHKQISKMIESLCIDKIEKSDLSGFIEESSLEKLIE